MKKTVAIAAVAGLTMLGAAGQASAYFEENHLTQVFYHKDFNEVIVDLGAIGVDFNLTDKNKVLAVAGTVNFGMAGVSSWTGLSMGYYADNSDWTIGEFGPTAHGYSQYSATTNMFIPVYTQNLGTVDGFDQGVDWIGSNARNNWGANDSAVVSYAIAENPISYYAQLNGGGKKNGTYADQLEQGFGEGKLDALDAGGYVDMYLYHYGTDMANLMVAFDQTYMYQHMPYSDGSNYAVLRLNADGSTILNPTSSSEVPLPGTMLLFGSSLLGLFGIRRKQA